MRVGLDTSVRDVRGRRRLNPNDALELDPDLSAEDLVRVCNAHSGQPYSNEMYELALRQPAANAVLLRSLLSQPGADSEVQNLVITSGRATREILVTLANSPHESVREHAAVAKVSMDLDQGEPVDIVGILEGAADDAGIGMRWTLARHPRTPSDVLETLSQDEVDVVANAAKAQLMTRGVVD